MFFFEKKTKKLSDIGVRLPEGRDSDSKVFCFFFSKKKSFLSFDQPRRQL